MEKIDESVYLSWVNYKRVILLFVIDCKYNQPVSAGQRQIDYAMILFSAYF